MVNFDTASAGMAGYGLGFITQFPESTRNTDPGAASVLYGVTYKIHNSSKIGTLVSGSMGGSGSVSLTGTVEMGSVQGASA